jgi:YidC/Oxa1 family membrane protein insertase
MIRRSAIVVSRLSLGLQAAAGEAAASSAAARPLAALSSLQLLDPWQSGSSQRGGGSSHSAAPFAPRNFSIFPGGGRRDEPAARDEELTGGDAFAAAEPSSAAAAAAGAAGSSASTGALSDYSPDAILHAASAAEAAALELAVEGAWAPTRALDWLLSNVHMATGLPWWQSIMLTTVGIRVVMMPLMWMQIRNTHALSAARPEIERLLERLKEEQARGNQAATQDYQKQVMGVWAKHKAHPLKSVVGMVVQAPLFIGFFSALRGLAAAKVPSLAEGGALWFTDLTVADPTYALPVIASATFLLTVEAGAADGMEGQPEKMKKRMKNIMRGVAVVIVPFTLNLPAAVFMYWTTSNAFSLAQTMLLKIPGAKKALGLPELKKGGPAAAEAGKPAPPMFAQKPRRKGA